MLGVGIPGHDGLFVALGAVEQGLAKFAERLADLKQSRPAVHLAVGGHLIVARARGVQPAAHLRPRALAQIRLDIHVDIFQLALQFEAPVLPGRLCLLQPTQDLAQILLRDDPTFRKHDGMGLAAPDVLKHHGPIGGGGLGELEGDVRHVRRESPAPELRGFAVGRHLVVPFWFAFGYVGELLQLRPQLVAQSKDRDEYGLECLEAHAVFGSEGVREAHLAVGLVPL